DRRQTDDPYEGPGRLYWCTGRRAVQAGALPLLRRLDASVEGVGSKGQGAGGMPKPRLVGRELSRACCARNRIGSPSVLALSKRPEAASLLALRERLQA